MTDRGLRSLFFDLFAALDLVMSKLRSEQLEREREKAKASAERR